MTGKYFLPFPCSPGSHINELFFTVDSFDIQSSFSSYFPTQLEYFSSQPLYSFPDVAMEVIQSFRLDDALTTAEINLYHAEGQTIVNWQDIEQAFPGVKRVFNGNSVIRFSRGDTSTQER